MKNRDRRSSHLPIDCLDVAHEMPSLAEKPFQTIAQSFEIVALPRRSRSHSISKSGGQKDGAIILKLIDCRRVSFEVYTIGAGTWQTSTISGCTGDGHAGGHI